MSHGSTEHHLEEAQHAQHAIHDNFTRNVAMTMAIMAAGLAFATLISHRQHNATIQLRIQSNDKLTAATDKWAHFQAKKNRAYMKEDFADLLALSAVNPMAGTKTQAQVNTWRETAQQYQAQAATLEKEAQDLDREANEFSEEAHQSHFTSNFFDVGHLGIDLALVVCSLAILTRKSLFWFLGMGIAVLGLAVALSGFVVPQLLHHGHAAPTQQQETKPAEHHAV
jgi:Domain of unknown function (DUF4337)